MRLLAKLLVALVVPVVVLFTVFAFVAYEVSRSDLDAELGRRLEAIAASAGAQIKGQYLIKVEPGDETDPAYLRDRRTVTGVAKATGAHVFVIDKQFDLRVDSDDKGALGTHDYRAELDRVELARVFAHGDHASSVTFEGQDGITYKLGYAPVRASDTDPTIVLAIGAQAPASYFDRLADLRGRLLLWGAGLALVTIAAAAIAALLVTRNVRKLAAAAERIGAGDLTQPVKVETRDEIGVLAGAMERMREQLAQRDLRMQQMLAGIAHEVRNPLAGMTLFAGILKEEIPGDDERHGHVERILRELGYLERVVNDFLEYARRPKPELADVEVQELLDEVAQLASTDAVAVKVEPAGELVARADRGQLRRALLNLAKNAVQATVAAGQTEVALSAAPGASELAFRVWNRGKDIPPETSGKLFDPFYTTKEKGTGLGLAFVREIAADHGGRVDVASADGETTFTLVIPSR